MDILGELPPLDIGLTGIVTLIVLLIISGVMPTPKAHREALAQRDRVIEDALAQRDKAMDLATTWQKVATEHGMTLIRLLDYAETANHALTSIQGAVQPRPAGEQAP